MKLYEMEGFLRGKCIPGNMKVNETNAEYLVRKFSEADSEITHLKKKLSVINSLMEAAEQANKLAQEATEKLVQECNALAAENAGMKDINSWCKTDAFKNMYREFKTAEALGCHDVDCMHDAMLTALMHAPKTPATDAFLAEVRASALPENIAEIIDSGDLETICWQHEHYKAEDYRLALYRFREDRVAQSRHGAEL